MAKVHPTKEAPASSKTSKNYMTSKRETFTIWMKSLVMQANGCTAFNDNGEIVYRIDNYDDKHCDEVFLMDLRGKVLFTLRERKIMGLSRSWNGYGEKGEKPMFRVRKRRRRSSSSYKVAMECDGGLYMLQSCGDGKLAFRVNDSDGRVVAEAKRKQSCSGVELGDDVLSLVVESDVDHSFVMALMIVYGLIKRRL